MEALLSTCPSAEPKSGPGTKSEPQYILKLSCAAAPGIVAAVTTALAEQGANLVETTQFWDRQSNRFFLRVAFLASADDEGRIFDALAPIKARFEMEMILSHTGRKPRIGGVRRSRTRLHLDSEAVLYAAPRPRHSARAADLFNLKISRRERVRP